MSFLERLFDHSAWEEKRRLQQIEQRWEEIERRAKEERPLVKKNIEESGIVTLLEELRDKTPGAILKIPKPWLLTKYGYVPKEKRPVRLISDLTVEPSRRIVPCSIFYLGILGILGGRPYRLSSKASFPYRRHNMWHGVDESLTQLSENQFLAGINVKVLPDKISIEMAADYLEFRDHILVQATSDALSGDEDKRVVVRPPWVGLKDTLSEMFNRGVESCAIVDCHKVWVKREPYKRRHHPNWYEVERYNRSVDEFIGRCRGVDEFFGRR